VRRKAYSWIETILRPGEGREWLRVFAKEKDIGLRFTLARAIYTASRRELAAEDSELLLRWTQDALECRTQSWDPSFGVFLYPMIEQKSLSDSWVALLQTLNASRQHELVFHAQDILAAQGLLTKAQIQVGQSTLNDPRETVRYEAHHNLYLQALKEGRRKDAEKSLDALMKFEVDSQMIVYFSLRSGWATEAQNARWASELMDGINYPDKTHEEWRLLQSMGNAWKPHKETLEYYLAEEMKTIRTKGQGWYEAIPLAHGLSLLLEACNR